MHLSRLVLASLAVGLAGLAIAEGLAPPPPPIVLPPPALPQGGVPTDRIDATGLVATIAARPLFRPDRRPVALVARSDGALPRLSGIMFSPTLHVAIFTPATGRTQLVVEGGRVGAYRLTAMTASSVTLTGAGGVLVLTPRFAGGASAAEASNPLPLPSAVPLIQTPGR